MLYMLMSFIGDWFAERVLNHLYRGAATPRRDTYYLAACTADPTASGPIAEPDTNVWTNYARQAIDATAADSIFSAATAHATSGYETETTEEVAWEAATMATPATDEVEVTHIALMASEAGTEDIVRFRELSPSRTVQHTDVLRVAAGNLSDRAF